MDRKEQIRQVAHLYSPNNAHHTADTWEYACEWADKTMWERCYEWLKTHYQDYAKNELGLEYLLNDLKQAMLQ